MPYLLRRRNKKWCVMKRDTDGTLSVVKCHPNKTAALAHQRALIINVDEAKTMPDEFFVVDTGDDNVNRATFETLLKQLDDIHSNFKFFGSPKSFEEMEALEAAEDIAHEIWKLGNGWHNMFVDIMFDPDNPMLTHAQNVTEKIDLLRGLADGFAKRVSRVQDEMVPILENMKSIDPPEPEPAPEQTGLDYLKEIFSHILPYQQKTTEKPETNDDVVELSDNVVIMKGLDGKFYLYGRPTNNIYDREGEVLTDSSHREFMKYLDEHPDEAPELWDWHTPGTQRKNRACWWDYADGFVHMMWELTPDEATRIQHVAKSFTPGMSHGYHVVKRYKEQYLIYRTFEASLLPLEYAANLFTTYEVLQKESTKMFSDTKRAFLLKTQGESKLAQLERDSENAKALLDAQNVRRKESGAGTDTTPPDTDADADASGVVTVEEQFRQLEQTTTKGFASIIDVLKPIVERITALEQKSNVTPKPAVDTSKTLAAVVEGIATFEHSVLPSKRKEADSDTVAPTATHEPAPAAVQATITEPEQTTSPESEHLLSGLFPKVNNNGHA